jgi:hypothetical protein
VISELHHQQGILLNADTRSMPEQSISRPRIETSARGTESAYLASDWGDLLKIPRSMLLTRGSSAMTSEGETKWKDALDQGSESIL